eukprot:TRINITY_DN315_c0_g1_i1.p3 TRINITY_DN315_c0_g1~~TRINITY_DN315_c0_g1_i1.p3  ORF type:complete len:156 (+),score=60.02 TRINITY_DN315_c0_g1_i1:128-595(+)
MSADMEGFSDEQIAEYKEAFALFDKQGNGAILSTDVGTVMRSLGQNPTESEIKEFLEGIQQEEGPVSVDFQSFLKMMSKKMKMKEATESELREIFKVFDKDSTGTITSALLRHIMGTLGEKLTPEEVEEMMAEADIDSDDKINYDEFVKSMLQSK